MIITADHGNDPTFRGTDHTRERVPLLVIGSGEPHDLGIRESFSDVEPPSPRGSESKKAGYRAGTSCREPEIRPPARMARRRR